jgi:hypothetical protein
VWNQKCFPLAAHAQILPRTAISGTQTVRSCVQQVRQFVAFNNTNCPKESFDTVRLLFGEYSCESGDLSVDLALDVTHLDHLSSITGNVACLTIRLEYSHLDQPHCPTTRQDIQIFERFKVVWYVRHGCVRKEDDFVEQLSKLIKAPTPFQ